jgi:hypothetical protein
MRRSVVIRNPSQKKWTRNRARFVVFRRVTRPGRQRRFSQSALSRGPRHAFGLFGLFCTKQTLMLLLLELRFRHRHSKRRLRSCQSPAIVLHE